MVGRRSKGSSCANRSAFSPLFLISDRACARVRRPCLTGSLVDELRWRDEGISQGSLGACTCRSTVGSRATRSFPESVRWDRVPFPRSIGGCARDLQRKTWIPYTCSDGRTARRRGGRLLVRRCRPSGSQKDSRMCTSHMAARWPGMLRRPASQRGLGCPADASTR